MSGNATHETQQIPLAAPREKKPSFVRRHPVVTGSVASALAFFVGVTIGVAPGAARQQDLSDQLDAAVADAAEVREDLEALQAESDAAIADVEARLEEAESERLGAEKIAKEAETAIADVAQREEDVDEKTAALEKLTEELESRETAVRQREDAVNAAEQRVTVSAPSSSSSSSASSSGSTSSGSSSSGSTSGSSSWTYKNCTEARAAGAAPVYRDDPGYGKHLDRDGDGIGCE